MRILYSSNSVIAPTGYGTQSQIVYKFLEMGHEVVGQCFYGHQGSPLNINGITWLPSSKDAYSNDMHEANFIATNADVLITLIDAWVIKPEVAAKVRWIPYMPVDSYPLAPKIIESIQAAYRIIVYSEFAKNILAEEGFDSYYVPHFVDPQVFRPLSNVEKKTIRENLKIPEDAFVAFINAANKGMPSRKNFFGQFKAWSEFIKDHPNSYLILNTDVWGGYFGEPIPYQLKILGIPMENVRMPNYFKFMNGMQSQQNINELYNAADVVLNASLGGGFELAILEGAAAGTVAISTDHSAMTEVTKNCGGFLVKTCAELFFDQAIFGIPDAREILMRLHEIHDLKEKGELEQVEKNATKKALEHYHIDKIVRMWENTLNDIEKDIRLEKSFFETKVEKEYAPEN